MYRSGEFPVNLNPDPTVGIPAGSDPSYKIARISEPRLSNRVMLTDFWYGYFGSSTTPNGHSIPHGDGKVVNLLWTDGHVSAWKLPDRMIPIWDWFGGTCTKRTTYNNNWGQQCPWWWVEADYSK